MGYAGEFRGGKHTLYEGGLRVPFIIRWPNHVPANRVDETSVIGGIDWLPTLSSISGVEIDEGLFDGEDVSDIWLGQHRERSKPLFWIGENKYAIREGKWKFSLSMEGDNLELYDLSISPQERTNVVDKHPDIAQDLERKIKAWKATLPYYSEAFSNYTWLAILVVLFSSGATIFLFRKRMKFFLMQITQRLEGKERPS